MTQLTRRSLVGGLTAAGAGTLLLPATAHAGAPAAQRPAWAPTAPRPAQAPPRLTVLTHLSGTAQGYLFLTPQGFAAPDEPRGPQIVDDQGQQIWFRHIPAGTFATDFHVQSYQGRPVLTWWEGTSSTGGVGSGTGYIANENYEVVATVTSPDPEATLDLHEFRITPDDTALVITYRPVPQDLTPVGGPQDGTVNDCVVREIDIATGQELFAWHGIEHVPVEEADISYSGATQVFDYLHVNAVSLDGDGALLISGRHTSTVYKVDRQTGQVIWRLGGVNSDFQPGTGVRFTGHHDGQSEGGGVYRVFDNGIQVGRQGPASRVAWIEVDEDLGTATLLDQATHPEGLSTLAEGNAQRLPNGNTLVSWGSASRVSEFSADGQLLFDGSFPQGISSYRAYRQSWQGQPATAPQVAVDATSGRIHALWNGATHVAAWRVLGGASEARLRPVARVPWAGLDTPVPLSAADGRDLARVQVQALDARGRLLHASPVMATGEAP